jgi:hypothetical protein
VVKEKNLLITEKPSLRAGRRKEEVEKQRIRTESVVPQKQGLGSRKRRSEPDARNTGTDAATGN